MERNSGVLTNENIEAFVEQLQTMLAGKLYTFVTVNESMGNVPDIRINQILEGRNQTAPGAKENIKLFPADDRILLSSMNVCDTYGVWSLDTYENFTHFSFEPAERGKPEQLTLRFKSGSGDIIHWLIAVEGPIAAARNEW